MTIKDDAERRLGRLRISTSAATDQRILAGAAAALAAATTGRVHQSRTSGTRLRTPLAAATVLLAGCLVGLWLVLACPETTITWADVQKKIENANTVSYTAVLKQEGMPEWTIKEMVQLGLIRQEITVTQGGGPRVEITVIDLKKGKALQLNPQAKKAYLLDVGLPEQLTADWRQSDFLAGLKRLIKTDGKELGARTINGRKAKGYQVAKDQEKLTIWADAKTGVPLEMEMTIFQKNVQTFVKDFEFDMKLDEALFSLTPPKGYEVITGKIDAKQPTVEDVAEALRVWTRVRGGTFPDTLTPAAYAGECGDLDNKLPKDEVLKIGQYASRMFILLQIDNTVHYAGKGVKLGQKDQPVFWHRAKGSKGYIVIYGDLSIHKDVPASELPGLPRRPVREPGGSKPAAGETGIAPKATAIQPATQAVEP